MNLKEMANDLGLDEDELMELMELFITTTLSDLEQLRDAVERQDFRGVAAAAHSIKGAARSFGFDDMAEDARSIEARAQQGSTDGSLETAEVIRENAERLTVG